MDDGALAPGSWAATVRADRDPSMVATLAERRSRRTPRRSVSVTELLDLRSAYWRAIAPIEPTPERRAILAAGRESHVRIGHELAPARYREVRIQREGIVGQIDLLEDRPTEIKTTSHLPEPDALSTSRPSYVEQLGMYCAMVGVPEGRLILLDRPEAASPTVAVYGVAFASLDRIWTEMQERATQLRQAIESHRPEALPRCPWRQRGCEYQAANACDCSGSERPPSGAILGEVKRISPEAEIARQIVRRIGEAPKGAPPAARRFRDLVYPRRAYFERVVPEAEIPVGTPRWQPSQSPDDLYRTLLDLLEAGPSGEVSRETAIDGEPLETVLCVRGDPVLVKVSRAWKPATSGELLAGQPQYFLELGLRCAALRRPSGWLVLGYERAETWAEKVVVFQVRFDPFAPVVEVFDARRRALVEALTAATPGSLPACPAWMSDSCDYKSRCGCGAAATTGRENR